MRSPFECPGVIDCYYRCFAHTLFGLVKIIVYCIGFPSYCSARDPQNFTHSGSPPHKSQSMAYPSSGKIAGILQGQASRQSPQAVHFSALIDTMPESSSFTMACSGQTFIQAGRGQWRHRVGLKNPCFLAFGLILIRELLYWKYPRCWNEQASSQDLHPLHSEASTVITVRLPPWRPQALAAD
jgi:hypothetical protein